MRARFTRDNTQGYDARDLATLNAAWDRINFHGAVDRDEPGTQATLDHWAEQLLFAYDQGKRGEALTAWFYAP